MSASSNFVRFVRGLRIALFGVPHRHRWETIQTGNILRTSDHAQVGTHHILRCRGCGEITSRTV